MSESPTNSRHKENEGEEYERPAPSTNTNASDSNHTKILRNQNHNTLKKKITTFVIIFIALPVCILLIIPHLVSRPYGFLLRALGPAYLVFVLAGLSVIFGSRRKWDVILIILGILSIAWYFIYYTWVGTQLY